MTHQHELIFVGAGPGDPELITVKGKRAVEEADIIVYAGSLVNPEVLSWNKKGAEVFNSATMNLQEIVDVMKQGYRAGKKVVRLHTGDPSIYGAIGEQMTLLDAEGIPYILIPGVSSFLGAVASLQRELTVPEVCQTVILSRCEGRTPVPEKENLQSLAQHQASLILFLSASQPRKVQDDLLTAYPPETPVAIVYKATWEEEKIYHGTVATLASLITDNKITRTALIFIGSFLKGNKGAAPSKLYDAHFSHGYRKGVKENNAP